MSLKGKTISILGDSISTFTNISDGIAADTTNSTIRNNAVYYSAGTWGVSQKDTWWQQAIDRLGLRLLVNNSWSGSCILHTRFGTVGAYADRCIRLHIDTGENAGEEPDLIAVYLGTNDYSYYQSTLGTASAIDYGALITENGDGTFSYAEPKTSCEAYAITLHKMKNRYRNAEIYCMTLLPRRNTNSDGVGQPVEFNESLSSVAKQFGCHVVDLYHSGISSENETFDRYFPDQRVHPNCSGMDVITECFAASILRQENAKRSETAL